MPDKKIISLDELSRYNDKISETYAKQNGYYETLTSGNADNLTPYGENSGAYDDTPFVFQTSGGSADIGNGAYLKALRGNSVAFNQLNSNNYYNGGTVNGITFVKNANGSWTISGTASASVERVITSFPIIANHKYLLKGCPSGGSTNSYWLACGQISQDDIGSGIIGYRSSDTTGYIAIRVANGTAISGTLTFKPQQFDLTLMFGAGNEPTSVLEFNRLFPKAYYEYNAGTLLSCKSNGYKIVGYNAFDGEIESGTYSGTTGLKTTQADNYRSKNNIKVIAGQQYTLEWNVQAGTILLYFYDGNNNFINYQLNNTPTGTLSKTYTIPDNCSYITFAFYKSGSAWGTTPPSNTQIAFHLTWDGSKTGYEPYYTQTYALPNVELKSAGSVYDELKPDGTLIRRVGSVDLSTLDWTWVPGIQGWKATINDIKYVSSNQNVANAFCSKYKVRKASGLSTFEGNCLAVDTADIKVQTTGIENNSDKPTGYLNYELATPTEEQTTNTFQEITKIDDFGTQEFLSSASIVVPQGNDFFYPVDYKAFVDSLGGRDDIEYDASEIVSHSELSAYDVIDAQLKDAIGGTLRQCVSIKGSIDFNNTTWVDLGTLNWTAGNANGKFYVPLSGIKIATGYNAIPNIACSKYQTGSKNQFDNASVDKIIAISDGIAYIYVYDSGAGTDATTFKNSLKGVLLAYEKAS